jgi:hypothetical protein
VTILLADGLGDFDAATIDVGLSPTDAGLGDLGYAGWVSPDAPFDSYLDLVVASPTENAFFTFINDGTGVFSLVGPHSPAGVVSYGVTIGRIGGSQAFDVFACGGGSYRSTAGVGDGTMSGTSASGAAGTDLRRAVGGNFTSDQDSDQLVVDPGADQVHFFLGSTGASFEVTSYDVGASPSAAAFGDVTGDGGSGDIVVANADDDTITVIVGNGTSTFVHPVTLDVGDGPSGVALADFNGDGVRDIVVSNAAGGTVELLLSDP